jgi:hypothetical protein
MEGYILLLGLLVATLTVDFYLKYEKKKNDRNPSIDEENEEKHNGLNTINAIFLIILAVSGNFTAEVLGCRMRKLLEENMYVKQLVIFSTIYFSLGFVDINNSLSPFDLLRRSILIWIFFLAFNRMHSINMFIVLSLIVSTLIIKNWIDYLISKDYEKNIKVIRLLYDISDGIFLIACVITIYGFFKYMNAQKIDHSGEFNFNTFMFGNAKCLSF